MRVVLAALRSIPGNPAANVGRLCRAVSDAAADGAHAVLVGEGFLQGSGALTDDPETDLPLGVSQDGALMAELRRCAANHEVVVGFGYFERDGNALFSAYRLLGSELDENYRRITAGWRHRTADPTRYREGPGARVLEWDGLRVGIALCGDLWDRPDAFSGLGAQLLLWPVHVSWRRSVWESRERAAYAKRAALAGCPTLLVNVVGGEHGAGALGGAAVFNRGDVLAEAPFSGDEQFLVWDSSATAPSADDLYGCGRDFVRGC